VTTGDLLWATHADGTVMERIGDVIRRRAVATPAGVAMQGGGDSATFAELDRRSNQVANGLLSMGCSPRDRVLFIGANSPAFVEVSYGAAKAGAVFAPISHRLSPREVVEVVADAAPALIVIDARLEPLLAGVPGAPDGPARLVVSADQGAASYRPWRDMQADSDPHADPGPDEVAVIMYSSGTTGLPKGIMLSGRNFACGLRTLNQLTEMTENSVISAPIPFFHISGYGQLLAANLNGARMVLEQPSSPSDLLAMLVNDRVSHAMLVPTVLQTLLSHPGLTSADLSALRYVMYGAAPISAELLERARATLHCKFLQSYGLTESTGGFTILTPEEHVEALDHPHRLRSTGRAMAGVRIRVVNPTTGSDVPVGEHGEIWVAGPRVMKGYWRQPELTAAAVVDGEWLRTGDGGSFDPDGFLYLHERIKDMIVSGGENIYPAEVERVLAEHPGVGEVAVVAVPSQRWGESPFGFVVPAAGAYVGAQVSEGELLEWTRERLARFKCPVGIAFVDELPRTPTGKIKRAVLRGRVPTPA
jgi:acyl-CoA synthetase (AMP-forming)/AMP-acid ligase II